MLELSQLLGLFTSKLMEQQEQVEEIEDAALDANENVELVRLRWNT
jgi:t-SNARE complex subunit (syntaxin)